MGRESINRLPPQMTVYNKSWSTMVEETMAQQRVSSANASHLPMIMSNHEGLLHVTLGQGLHRNK
jgi:hypothetical protein